MTNDANYTPHWNHQAVIDTYLQIITCMLEELQGTSFVCGSFSNHLCIPILTLLWCSHLASVQSLGYLNLLWSDTGSKWLKHSTVGQKVPGLNPTNRFTGKVFSLPLLPLGDQPLVDRGKILLFALFAAQSVLQIQLCYVCILCGNCTREF